MAKAALITKNSRRFERVSVFGVPRNPKPQNNAALITSTINCQIRFMFGMNKVPAVGTVRKMALHISKRRENCPSFMAATLVL